MADAAHEAETREPTDQQPRRQSDAPRGSITFRDRFVIDFGAPIEGLSTPSATAYGVEDRRDMTRHLFALVCNSGIPTRTDLAASLKGTFMRGTLSLADWGPAFWPPLNQSTMIMVYERPLGERILTAYLSGETISEYDLQRKIIEPLALSLQELANNEIAHRAIRPDNLFFMEDGRQALVLGDCLTTPPGYDQPVVFEPIERAMASRAGRGEGTNADDLYALGVTLAFLITGGNPVGKLSDDEVIAAKVEQGSYAALCSKARIPVALLEPLRGLLSDHPDERWSLRELSLWIDGRRMTPIQRRAIAKAEVPLTFGGRSHFSTRTLARSFSQNVPDAVRFMREPHMDTWLRRNLSSPEMADDLASEIDAARPKGEGAAPQDDNLLVARACIVLDPTAPVRFKGMDFIPEAFGPALAVEYLRHNDTAVGKEILAKEIVPFALNRRPELSHEAVIFGKLYKQIIPHHQVRDPGYGIERCLYEFNPSLTCQSSLVVQDYVLTIEDLLPALDRAADRVDNKIPPVDRHIAAFIGARFDQDLERTLKALGDREESRQVEGMVSMLAQIQWRKGPDALYGLTSWIGGHLAPIINSYHSRSERRGIEREIPRLIRQGSLPALFEFLDDPERRQRDTLEYNKAINEFTKAEIEIREVEGGDSNRAQNAERTGQQTAATVSMVLGMIFVFLFLIAEMY